MAAEGGLVGEVAQEHGLADAVWAEQHDIGAVLDEAQGHEVIDGFAVDPLGPGPVEVGDGLEGADAGLLEAALEAAAASLLLLERDEARQPGLVSDLGPAREQPEQAEALDASAEGVDIDRRVGWGSGHHRKEPF